MDTTELIEENREALEIVANADCSASWIAQELLDSIEGHTSDRANEPTQTHTTPTEAPQNDNQQDSIAAGTDEPEGSIFAY